MFNYRETLQEIKRERASMLAELEKLDQAIAALQALAGNKVSAPAKSGLSANARRGASHNKVRKTAKKKRKILPKVFEYCCSSEQAVGQREPPAKAKWRRQ
jgi:hypothetical protein